MMLALAFVCIPLLVYMVLLIGETYVSIARLRGDHRFDHAVDVTWEVTHTLFIFGVNAFMWMWSDVVPVLAMHVFQPLMWVALAFIGRGAAYAIISYTDLKARSRSSQIVHGLFTCTHIVIIIGILYTVRQVLVHMPEQYTLHTTYMPVMVIGAILTMLVCCIPVYTTIVRLRQAH